MYQLRVQKRAGQEAEQLLEDPKQDSTINERQTDAEVS
jgi:hypothetical protein